MHYCLMFVWTRIKGKIWKEIECAVHTNFCCKCKNQNQLSCSLYYNSKKSHFIKLFLLQRICESHCVKLKKKKKEMKLRKRRDGYNFFSGHSLQLAISFFFFRYFKKCRFTFVHMERKQKKLTFFENIVPYQRNKKNYYIVLL